MRPASFRSAIGAPDIARDGNAAGELRAGWLLLAGVTVAMFSGTTSLPYATSGMFVTALQHDFGWSRTAVSVGPALYMLGVVITSPLVGFLTERIDPRRMVVPGILVVAGCFLALSRMSGELWQYYCIFGLMALLGNLSGATALTAIIARHFRWRRGAALGIAMAGAGLSSAVCGPLVSIMIGSHGWRSGFVGLGLFCLAMTPFVWVAMQGGQARVREARSEPAGDTFREAVAKPIYWTLSLAFFLVSFGSTGLIVHFVPLLTDRSFDRPAAAALSSMIGLSMIVSRLLTGFVVDRVFAPRVAMVLMLAGAISFLLFLLGGTAWAVLAAVAVGISFGSETDLVGFMVARYFGLRNFGRLFGLMYGFCLAGVIGSPVLYGIVRDRFGNYDPMVVCAALLLACAAVIFALLPPFPDRSTGPIPSKG